MPRSVTHVARLLPAAMLLALLGAGVGLRMAPPAQAAGTPFYLHGSGPYTFDQTSPSGSTQTFAMTAANATRTWATTTTPSGSQTIHPSSTFSLNYWTTGAGTSASTNLTLGYSASSTCVSGIARVQLGTEAVNSSGLSVSPTLASASTAGNLLVATVYGNSTVTLNGPAGWTRAAAVQGTGVGEVETWYYANNPGGITTATWSSQSGGAPTMAQLSEWSGVATSSPVDATGTANVAATTTPTATAGSATTGGGELAVGVFTGSVYNIASWTQGSGWTSQMKDLSNAFFADYKTGVSAGQTVSESPTSGTSAAWGANVTVFKAQPSVTTVAQGTSITLSNGSNLTSASFSPAADVTVPTGSYFCITILVNSVVGGGVTLSSDAAGSATNLNANPAFTISGTPPGGTVTTNNLYVHGASTYTADAAAPTGSTTQTFAMTAASATRTWATTTTPSVSQTIGTSSTFSLDYWTTGAGTASTTLTFGYSANAGCGAPTIAQVQQGTSVHSTASASATLTLPAASTAGHLLVATVSSSGTVTVSTGATGWTQAIAKQGNGGTTTIWYSQNAASTSSVTFSVSSGLDIVGQLSEWSGAATSGALDATGSTSTTNQLAPPVTTGTSLTTSGELGITAWETSSTETGGYTAGSGWTHLYSDPTPSAGHGTVADYTIGLASGATASETETGAVAEKWSAAIATFVPASSSNTTIAQATSVTLSSGSNLTTANFSPASSVTVPAGSFFCLTILVNSVAGGGVTLSYDAAASATNLVCNPAITISGGGLSGVQWQVSSTQTSATGVTYVFLFTLGSTDAISSVRVTLPSGTTGSSLTVNAVYGLGAGSASLSGTTLTYTLTTPLTVAGGTPAYLSISGFGNTGTTGAATATVADWNATSQLESGTASVTFASTGTNTTTPTSRSLTFTNDTASWQIQMDPGVAALADQSRTITLTVKSNARSGYSLNVKDAGLSTTAPVKTIAPVTAGMATGVAAASFPVDALGYSATVSSPGGSGLALQGAGLSGGKLVGFTTAGEVPFAATGSTAGSADTIAMTVRVRISYATVSGVYSDTITYAVSPSY